MPLIERQGITPWAARAISSPFAACSAYVGRAAGSSRPIYMQEDCTSCRICMSCRDLTATSVSAA